jgi:hypothetical protein
MPSSKIFSRRAAISAATGLLAASARVGHAASGVTSRFLDLETPEGRLEGYLKARSDISGKMALSWTSGLVFGVIPGRPARPLMLGQGVKATRCIKDEHGYMFLERECVIFSDRETGEPLKTWFNPFTERTVDVFHIQNDQAGMHLDPNGSTGQYHLNYIENSGDVTFYDDLFYTLPSPLDVDRYPAYTESNVYEGAGIYHFHAKRADLDNPSLSSAPVTTSHTGIRQWMPWMEMGAWAGNLVLPSRGKKLPGGVEDLPKVLRGWLEKNAPRYLEAPTMVQKDERHTFYDEFKKYIDAKRALPARP